MSSVRWSYMDHWRTDTPRGPSSQYASRREMDRFVKQVRAVGITALEVFDFRLGSLAEMFGSLENYRTFLRQRDMHGVVGMFHLPWYLDAHGAAPHDRATHDAILARAEAVIEQSRPLELETFVVMPAASYPFVAPVTDDKLKAMGELWTRVGEMTLRHGIRTAIHHEFWCGVRSRSEIDRFYAATDPRYVFLCLDTAQHVIAGVDPAELVRAYGDRCVAMHFKDTHDVDTAGEYRRLPDAEMIAESVDRWFWEMGTPEGRVDFPAVMRALADIGYRGWICVEHDKADANGGRYTESTAVAMWYARNVLEPLLP